MLGVLGDYGVINKMTTFKKKKGIFLAIIGIIIIMLLYSFPDDKRQNLLMVGTRYESPIYYLTDSRNKTKVFIISGIHGNEVGGIGASERIITQKYEWADMTIIPRANEEAYKLKVRNPYYMSDLNRAFPGKENGTDTERLAYEIFNLVKKGKPDIVIDLHEWDNKFDEDNSLLTNGLVINSVGGRLWESGEKVYNQYNKLDKKDKLLLNIGPPSGSINKEISERLNIPVITIESNMNNSLEDRIDFHLYIIENIINEYEMDG